MGMNDSIWFKPIVAIILLIIAGIVIGVLQGILVIVTLIFVIVLLGGIVGLLFDALDGALGERGLINSIANGIAFAALVTMASLLLNQVIVNLLPPLLQ